MGTLEQIFCYICLYNLVILVLLNQKYVILSYIFIDKRHNMTYVFALYKFNPRAFIVWQLISHIKKFLKNHLFIENENLKRKNL